MKKFIIKFLISILLTLVVLILTKSNNNFKTNLYKEVYSSNLPVSYLNKLYNQYLGPILPFELINNTSPVFSEKLEYKSKKIYKDGVCLEVNNNYLVPSLEEGLVIFIGEKEDYGKTIIIEQANKVETWYGNLDNINVKLYDYISKGKYLANTKDNNLYLVFKENGNILNYEEYIK